MLPRRRQSRGLPRIGWTWPETIRGGGWRRWGAIPGDIPARFVLDGRGVWLVARQGVRGLLGLDEGDHAVTYVICEPALYYYCVMTGMTRMPVYINERSRTTRASMLSGSGEEKPWGGREYL
jgi:hypothetical protein